MWGGRPRPQPAPWPARLEVVDNSEGRAWAPGAGQGARPTILVQSPIRLSTPSGRGSVTGCKQVSSSEPRPQGAELAAKQAKSRRDQEPA